MGISQVFCHALGPILLYSFERAQYADLLERHTGSELASIYGGEHLLRLLLRFPDMLREAVAVKDTTDKQQHATHRQLLARLIEFMHDGQAQLLAPVYENCTPAYLRLSALAGV